MKNNSVAMLKKKYYELHMPYSVNIKHYQYMLHIVNCKHRLFQNMEEVFLYLNMYCWNCFQYKLVRDIVKTNSCSQALIARMEVFERDTVHLRKRSKISEFINSRESSIKMKPNLIPPNFILVTTEHDIDPNEHKLIILDNFCEDFVTNFNLQAGYAFQIIMIDLKQGGMVVEWMTPSELQEVIISSLSSEVGRAILMKHKIKDAIIDERSVMERWAVRIISYVVTCIVM